MLDVLYNKFVQRQNEVLHLISEYENRYNLEWNDIGVFGSFARREANATSDIDIVIIAEKPDRYISGNLREEADMLKADIVFMRKEDLLNSDSLFCRNIRRDIKFVKGGFPIE